MKKVNKAFSIAEAFIMLTIVSVALAAAAPMITKQIKHNNLSNVQTNILGREINQAENKINVTNKNIQDIVGTGRTAEQYAQYIASLEARIRALEGIDIENLQAQINEKISANDLANKGYLTQRDLTNMDNYLTKDDASDYVTNQKLNEELNKVSPKGSILLLNTALTGNNGCPSGWINISTSNVGKYIMFDSNANAGTYNDAYLPNHWHGVGAFYPGDNDMLFHKRFFKHSTVSNNGSGFYIGYGDSVGDPPEYAFSYSLRGETFPTLTQTRGFGTTSEIYSAKSGIATATNKFEVKPASISVIACRKN